MRNILYTTLGIVVKKDGQPNRLYFDVSRETSLYIALESLITESRNKKAEIFCSFCGLKYQAMSVINYLYKAGYHMLSDANKKDLRVGSYRLRYTGENCYYIQIKTGYKSFVTLQNIEAVIGLKKMPESLEELKKATDLYNYTRKMFLDGVQRSETRILYGSASISRTMFNRANNSFCYAVAGLKKTYIHKQLASEYLENYCRPAVHSGYNYLSETGRNYTGDGVVLDVNSLYDFIASTVYLPYPYIIKYGDGAPEKKYIRRKHLYYTIMQLEVSATLKENGIPCILADGVHYSGCDYLTEMRRRKLTLTESDREMLFENYNISYYKIESYVVLRSDKKIFADYIKPLYEQKRTLPKGMERDFVKSMLVGFIGTFARKVYTSDYDFVEKDGCLIAQKISKTANEIEKEYKRLDGMCFLNAAIVSASREYIVCYIKKHMDRFLYTDTDSIHLSGQEIPSDIPVSDKMGDFKVEHTFTRCEYRDIKKYMIVENGVIIPTIAGIPKDSFKQIIKAPGIDTKKISKYIAHKDIHHLFLNPIGIMQIEEDIDTATCNYTSHAVKLSGEDMRSKISKKISEYRRKREGWDYVTGCMLDESLHKYYNEAAKARRGMDKWNYAIKAGIIKDPTIEDALQFLANEIYK